MKLAIPNAKANEGEIIALGVIDVPINLPLYEGMRLSIKVMLFLMGWKGYTTTRDWIMGEVTDEVVRLPERGYLFGRCHFYTARYKSMRAHTQRSACLKR